MEAVSLKNLFDIQFLSDVRLSPDGKNAAFVAAQGSIEDNDYKSNIWIYNLESKSVKRLTAMDSEKNLTWLDAETIIFPGVRNEKDKELIKKGMPLSVYYKINIHGGEAQKAFAVPLLAAGRLKKAGFGKFLTSAVYDHNLPNITNMTDPEKEAALKKVKEELTAFTVIDEIPFWANGQGVINKKRNRIYLIDADNHVQKAVSPPYMNVMGYKYYEESSKILYYGVEYQHMMELKTKLHIFDMNTNSDTLINLEDEYSISIAEIIGNHIVFFGILCSERDSCKNAKWHKVSLKGGKATEFTDLDISLGNGVGSDCRYGGGQSFKVVGSDIYYISSRGYNSYLFKLDMEGKETQISKSITGSIDCFDIYGNTVVFAGMRDKGLQEIYVMNAGNGEEEVVSEFNKGWLNSHHVSYPKHFVFNNRDGVALDGFVIEPVGFDESKTYPAILDIHGGPKAIYGDVFMHEMQLWANEGYFVFFTNPRGSDGKGSLFADINAEKYGVDDYNDIMDFTDKVLELYPNIDKDRVGVTGGSYGGLMTNWIVGRTDRYKAAATQRSISNFISKCLTTDIGYYHNLSQMGTTPWEDASIMWDKSPLKDADKVKTPLLFIHSDQDYRCYMADAFQFFTALKMHGVESRMCLFHGENHELSRSGKPKNRMKRLEEITNWMNKYLK